MNAILTIEDGVFSKSLYSLIGSFLLLYILQLPVVLRTPACVLSVHNGKRCSCLLRALSLFCSMQPRQDLKICHVYSMHNLVLCSF